VIDHEIFQRSELLLQNLIQTIDQPLYENSSRLCASGNFTQISIEHSCAVRTLSETRMFTSAFVVMRAQFEALLRAIWLLHCASDHQVQRLSAPLDPDGEQSAKNLPQPQVMLDALAKVPVAKVPFDALTEFKSSSWKALNSFTHAGLHPLKRLVEGYPLELIFANVRMSNALSLMAGMHFCTLTGIPNLQKELLPFYNRYKDCLPSHRASVDTEPAPI
jgi:hypothetical protein